MSDTHFGVNTLVVAPNNDLPRASAEAIAVANLLPGYLLQGNVTVNDLLAQAERGKWDILWFACHGDEYGVVLSDSHLSTSALTTLVRTSNAKLIVLNTCSSLVVALSIHNELLTDFICTIQPVPDLSAFLTGKQLALHLSRGYSPVEAYFLAKPGQNRDYVFLPGRFIPQTVATPISPITNFIPSQNELHEIKDELKRIVVLIDGKESWGQPGLRKTVSDLQSLVGSLLQDISERFNQVEKSVFSMRLVMWVMVAVVLILIITIAGASIWP